jgi:hypothetical protein
MTDNFLHSLAPVIMTVPQTAAMDEHCHVCTKHFLCGSRMTASRAGDGVICHEHVKFFGETSKKT